MLPSLGKKQIGALTRRIDADGDGTISEPEFANRFKVLQTFTASQPTTSQ